MSNKPTPSSPMPFGAFLRFWRNLHQKSQEQLADDIDSSARHISRLENGRVHPSNDMVLKIAAALRMNQRDTQHLLISAGYTGQTERLSIEQPQFKWLINAMKMTLKALEPHPSLLIDGAGKILLVNHAWVHFYQQALSDHDITGIDNYYDLLSLLYQRHADKPAWQDAISLILMNMQQDVLFSNNNLLAEKLTQMLSDPLIPDNWQKRAASLEPMASFRLDFALNQGVKRVFSVNQSVGATGPAAFVSEPRLAINTLYADDGEPLGQAQPGKHTHPRLYD